MPGSENGSAQGPQQDHTPNHVALTVVVNTTDTSIDANPRQPLRAVAEQALARSGSAGRALSDWTLKDEAGNPLDLTKTVGDYGFGPGTTLFLSLNVGSNG